MNTKQRLTEVEKRMWRLENETTPMTIDILRKLCDGCRRWYEGGRRNNERGSIRRQIAARDSSVERPRMAKDTCPRCHGKKEHPNRPICYGCHLDGYIPRWYPAEEGYEFVEAFGHSNATDHPQTGVPILDSTPKRIFELEARM
ncbi:hypothetical protein LCGC14_1996100 [marine sediment metagenome]|uniref:Uncharacterized protein n=1 Tax=marine sediment metagenome TaxID=412755 RepID=A0A0F9I1S6_9ZZZZ